MDRETSSKHKRVVEHESSGEYERVIALNTNLKNERAQIHDLSEEVKRAPS